MTSGELVCRSLLALGGSLLACQASLLTSDVFDASAMEEGDALLNVSDTVLVEVKGEYKEVAYRVYGLILRVFLLLFGTRASAEEAAGGDFESVVHIGVWEYECLKTLMFILCCDVDISHLPPVTPSAHTVHVASLFLGTVSAVTAAAQLLDLDSWMPEPAQIYSGRLFAHLHAGTPAAQELLQTCADTLPSYEIAELSTAVLSIFDDTTWLLYGGASEDVAAQDMQVDDGIAPVVLGLQNTDDQQQQQAAKPVQAPPQPGVVPKRSISEILPVQTLKTQPFRSICYRNVLCS